jgi:hypothetical protein
MDKPNDWNVYGHLRATIATAAMQGALAHPSTNSIFNSWHKDNDNAQFIAERCVEMADALIAELAKGGGK